MSLPPWSNDAFERLVNAERHFRNGEDFDRRQALIGFDNVVEVSIVTYLGLHPDQRGGRTYPKDKVPTWTRNFNENLNFLQVELADRDLPWQVEKTHVLFVHQNRNEQYHGGGKSGVPESKLLKLAREAAVWVFGLLFEVDDVEQRLADELYVPQPPEAHTDLPEIEEAPEEVERHLGAVRSLSADAEAPAFKLAESVVEEAALAWLEMLGYRIMSGRDLSESEADAERRSTEQVVLEGRLRDALRRLNPSPPQPALDEAFRKLLEISSPSLVDANRQIHRFLVRGVDVEYAAPDGETAYAHVRVLGFDEPDDNEWLAVNQLTVKEGDAVRRPDIVIYVNGLPLAMMELKAPNVNMWNAFDQLQTYKKELLGFLSWNALLVISDGLDARLGSLTAERERFMPWRTIEGEELASETLSRLEVLLRGVFDKRRFLDLVRHFVVFEEEGGKVLKKIAGYHQFHAVNVAVHETVRASSTPEDYDLGETPEGYMARRRHEGQPGDQRVGVVWHTQGSGKSLTMAFYAGRVIAASAMLNPTIVVITDRNDLDDQLFGTFSRCQEDLLRQAPEQARDREHLRELLQVASGGVVFTTVHKFFPEKKGKKYPLLSERRNIVVIADEAHRSQYDFIDGFARHMRDALPKASFIGFTGTPIEISDKNTRAVFGDYISVYDIRRAVRDRATVPIYYENRLAKIELDENERPSLDEDFEEVTEGEEIEGKEKLKTKWSAIEALVGTEKRIALVAEDLVRHFEGRLEALDGKAMVVCMSRRICVELYDALVRLRPEWHDADNTKGVLKVVMTGSAADGEAWQPHIRTKARREALANRFRDPDDPFRVVIVRDMWLTGFDAPSLHTMYVDKPMRGHGLMQAIARVNRVFRDKPGGLVVDYLGLAAELKAALRTYTESGGQGEAKLDQDAAVQVMKEKHEVCRALFHGFDYSSWIDGPPQEHLSLIPAAQEHVYAQDDGAARLVRVVRALSQAFALAVPHEAAIAIRDEVGFFQSVRTAVAKTSVSVERVSGEMDQAIRQIVSRAVSSDEVVDVFAMAGLKSPDISILSDDFLAEVSGMEHKNLAVELLRRLLTDEVRSRKKKNLVQSRSFAELLEKAIRRYQNRAIQAAQVIEELIALAKDMRGADARHEDLGLSSDEVAFYDALGVNDSAVQVLGDETLKKIAQELVETVRRNATIDWTVKESVRAKLRVMVRRILRKHKYPPDKQESATQTVLEQAELLSEGWASKRQVGSL